MRKNTEHFFNEIYSYYYSTVSKLIGYAVRGELTFEKEEEILRADEDFAGLLITDKLHDLNEWRIMKDEIAESKAGHVYQTYLETDCRRPVTLLEKRWLKSIIDDPRIRLFDIDTDTSLEGVEPLFSQSDYRVIGKYNDGDDFTDPGYIERFRLILKAIRNKWALEIVSANSEGRVSAKPYVFVPYHLEYSETDDKFRLYGESIGKRDRRTIIALGRIKTCALHTLPDGYETKEPEYETLRFRLENRNNSLDRVMVAFSHHNTKVRQEADGSYYVELTYPKGEDKGIAVLELMPFAHYITVEGPEYIKEEIARRLKNQIELFKS